MVNEVKPKFSYRPNTVYEITVNPNDQYQFAQKKDGRLQAVKSFTEDIFKSISDDAKYHLFCEISNPQYGSSDKNRYARVHYHGILLFKTPEAILKYLTTAWHKLTGSYSVQINEYRPEHWDEYCRKQEWLIPKRFRIMNASWKSICEMREITRKATHKMDNKKCSIPHLEAEGEEQVISEGRK